MSVLTYWMGPLRILAVLRVGNKLGGLEGCGYYSTNLWMVDLGLAFRGALQQSPATSVTHTPLTEQVSGRKVAPSLQLAYYVNFCHHNKKFVYSRAAVYRIRMRKRFT